MKKMKKLFNIFLLIAYLMSSPTTIAFAEVISRNDDGSVNAVRAGSLENEGDIQVTKSVSATDTPGRYKITFEIEGVPVKKSNPLYAAVVFDRSGSMICDPTYGYSDTVRNNAHFTAGDGQGLVCYNENGTTGYWGADFDDYLDSSIVTASKWNNAVAGAKTFQSTIKNALGDDAHVSLVTFASNASAATESFADSSFGHPYGGTNLAGAINNAVAKLNDDTRGVANAKKVILVISDGEPNSKPAATTAANTAKNSTNNIEIYAIGYQTNADTSDYLRSISSYNELDENDKHYSDADPSTVSAAVQEMVNELLAAGTDASITDTLTSEFTFTSDAFTGKSHTFTLNNITSEKQTVEFFVDIDQTLPTNIYDTNNTTDSKAVLNYTSPTGETKKIELNESPSVPWVRPSYNYTVNYYKDSVAEANKLGDSVINEAELSTQVTEDMINKELRLNLAPGYEFDRIETTPFTITDDEDKNVINVIYKKKNYEYKVNYYYENLDGSYEGPVSDNQKHEALFDSVIDEETITGYEAAGLVGHDGFSHERTDKKPLTITDNADDNVINIYYNRGLYNYCVYHYYDNELDDSKTDTVKDQKYGTVIEEVQRKLKDGYVYEKDEFLPLTIGLENNFINVYYKKRNDLKYTVEYYYDNELDDSKTQIFNNQTFESVIDEETIKGYEESGLIDGYKHVSTTPKELTIATDNDTNVIKIYYEKRDDLKYTVHYFYDGVEDTSKEEKVNNVVFGTVVEEYPDKVKVGYEFDKVENLPLTVGTNEDKNVINVYYKRLSNLEYTVNYHYEGNKDLDKSETYKNNTYGDEISKSTIAGYEESGLIDGYKHDKTTPEELTISENNDNNVIDIYYVKRTDLNYTVEHYYDNELDDSKTDTFNNQKYQDVINDIEKKPIEGYVFTIAEGLPLTIDLDNNLIKAYYERRNDLKYTVEYYFDGKLDDSLTEVYENQRYKDEITEYVDKVKDGYKFDKVENLPLTIGVNIDDNVIRVYYVSVAKETPIEIPKTGIHADTNNSYVLLMMLLNLAFISLLDRNKIYE